MGQDKRRLIIGILLSLGIVVGWQAFMKWTWPEWYRTQGTTPPPAVVANSQASSATTQATTGPSTGPSTQGSPNTTTGPVVAQAWHARGGDGGMPAMLGSAAKDDKKFVMSVAIARKGAAIDSVILNQFLKTAENTNVPYTFEEPLVVDGSARDDTRALQSRSISIDGNTIDLADVSWKVESSSD